MAGAKIDRDMGKAAVPRRAADVSRWDDATDVLVVGFGGAGACAALAARESDADVLILERMSGGGGTTALSTGQIYLGGGTAIQKACGFEDSAEAMFKYLLASCGPGADEAKIRAYADGSVEHFDWLTAHGMPFKESYYGEGSYTPTDDCLSWSGSELCHPYRDIADAAPRGHTVQQDGIEAGGQLMRSLIAAVESSGARIQTDTLVETLVVDDGGNVVGAIAKVDGDEKAISAAGGVVLCAGGFINNKPMVERYAPLLRKCKFRAASDGDDGRGIRMGMGAGGAAIRMDTGCIVLPFTVPKQLVKGIFVNRSGQRFIDESLYQTVVGEAALLHQGGDVLLIVDNAIYEPPFPPTELAAVEDTVEDLERSLGLPDRSLVHTVAYYNEHAEKGEDPLFHKQRECVQPLLTPPFAALDYSTDAALYTVFTMGGLHTAPTGQVLNGDGDPVPGLYAAGRTTSGVAAQGYSSGLSIGDATFFGRRAGAHAAARTRA